MSAAYGKHDIERLVSKIEQLRSERDDLLVALKQLSAGLHDGIDSNPRIKAEEVPVPPTYLPPPALQPIAIKPAPITRPPDTIIIRHGQGGRLDEHRLRFADYRRTKAKVEIRGPCYSACTLVTAYVEKADLCIAEGAFFAFHAVRSLETGKIMPVETGLMYGQQPQGIRAWIDRYGGYEKLPLDAFWTLHDRQLWAMGYPRCAP